MTKSGASIIVNRINKYKLVSLSRENISESDGRLLNIKIIIKWVLTFYLCKLDAKYNWNCRWRNLRNFGVEYMTNTFFYFRRKLL